LWPADRLYTVCGVKRNNPHHQTSAPAPSDGIGGERVFAVERALMLLQCFEYAGEARSLASLARQSGFYKSTILRLANSLCRMGFLLRGADGLFAVGPELTRLGAPRRAQIDVEDLIRSHLRSLADTKYSAFFCVRQDRRPVCLFREDASQDRVPVGKRARDPLINGAALQVLRAYGRHGNDKDLNLVRQRGWAVSVGSGSLDLTIFAVPVFNREKALLGALGLAGRSEHFSTERHSRLRQIVQAAAVDLGKDMRFVHPRDVTDIAKSVRLGGQKERALPWSQDLPSAPHYGTAGGAATVASA
jgi:DNA-binding IclR family transcriptional regulator